MCDPTFLDFITEFIMTGSTLCLLAVQLLSNIAYAPEARASMNSVGVAPVLLSMLKCADHETVFSCVEVLYFLVDMHDVKSAPHFCKG